MNDTMNEITAFSPFGGRLVLEEVKGAQERANVPENSIETKAGDDRSMYVYVPASGCPDAKQTQVVMFLRDGADEASAQAAMKEYGLDALAEKGMTRAEFEMARQQLKAGYILGQESTSARMNAAGRRLLLLNRTRSEEEVIRAIDGLTFEGANELAKELLSAEPSVALVGKGAEKALKGLNI